MLRAFAGGVIATLVSVVLSVAPAGARVDFSGPAFNILAPGEFGGLPASPFSTDQAQLYDALTPLGGHVTTADLSRYYLQRSSVSRVRWFAGSRRAERD